MNTTNATDTTLGYMPNMNESTMHTTPWKTYTEKRESFRIRATYGWHKIGNQEPYWSVTGETQHLRLGSWREDTGGCIHELVVRHFPELGQSIKWHLSGAASGPMHYIENAVYWAEKVAGISKYPDADDASKAFPAFCSTVVLGAIEGDAAPRSILGQKFSNAEAERAGLREEFCPAFRRDLRATINAELRAEITSWCLARKPALIAKMLEETGAVMALAT